MEPDYKALKNTGFMRQRQKNRFSLRLKVVGGRLTTEQLRAISEMADDYGSGIVHLTSRQGLEVPFIKLEDIDSLKEGILQGAISAGVCGPAVRTVTACQGDKVCPSGCIDTYALAEKISDRYYGRRLPHKFKIGLTGCVNNCLKAEENDVGVKGGLILSFNEDACSKCALCVKVCREKALSFKNKKIALDPGKCNNCGRCVKICPEGAWRGKPGYIVYFAGTFGNRIAIGKKLLPVLSRKEDLLKVVDRALDFFSEHGIPGERFRTTVDRTGWEPLAERLNRAKKATAEKKAKAG
ncbi:MAG: 4Fe-4S binding protein [Deltaproteobacteria bacterium]|jgi:dissimilatory sulfite reductase (desulfoviridin) alpha/beta subunit|nr:4Fe-4S binding protein [Deltaproteobacteria bacterium]